MEFIIILFLVCIFAGRALGKATGKAITKDWDSQESNNITFIDNSTNYYHQTNNHLHVNGEEIKELD